MRFCNFDLTQPRPMLQCCCAMFWHILAFFSLNNLDVETMRHFFANTNQISDKIRRRRRRKVILRKSQQKRFLKCYANSSTTTHKRNISQITWDIRTPVASCCIMLLMLLLLLPSPNTVQRMSCFLTDCQFFESAIHWVWKLLKKYHFTTADVSEAIASYV